MNKILNPPSDGFTGFAGVSRIGKDEGFAGFGKIAEIGRSELGLLETTGTIR